MQHPPLPVRSVSAAFLMAALLLNGCVYRPSPTATPMPSMAAPSAQQSPVPPSSAGIVTTFPTRPAPIATAPAHSTPTARPSLPSKASALPNPDAYTWSTALTGLTRPLDLSGLHDGSGRLLVVEQAGILRLAENGRLAAQLFLDIRDRVGSKGNEQGLLGLAIHPRFVENGLFYINYTDLDGNTVIARYQANAAHTQANPDSEQILLRVKQPYPNHNGGGMAFDADGYLYIGLGDGGSAGDPQGNAQNLDSLLGKLLRIDVDHGSPYSVPSSNPIQSAQGKPEIWAYGLRNPWRFSFDRATNDLYIGDVGQNLWEEVDFQPAGTPGGANFGWNYREGAHAYWGTPPGDSNLVEPVAEYKHPEGCSITGGYVYRGKALPEWQGVYLYSDYCNGKVWGLLQAADGTWQNQLLFKTAIFPSSFGQDDEGELYLVDQRSGSVLKLVKK